MVSGVGFRGGSRRVPPMRVHRSNQFENDGVTLLTNKRNLHELLNIQNHI